MSTGSCPSSHDHPLTGKTLLIIGGDRRPDQFERMRRAFPRTEIRWQPTRQSDASVSAIEREVMRPDVDVVATLIGLSRHSHTLAARKLCSALGKPLLWCHRATPAAVRHALHKHASLRSH